MRSVFPLLRRRTWIAVAAVCVVTAPVSYVLASIGAPEIAYYAIALPIAVPAIVYAMGGRAAFRRLPADQAARRRCSAGGA